MEADTMDRVLASGARSGELPEFMCGNAARVLVRMTLTDRQFAKSDDTQTIVSERQPGRAGRRRPARTGSALGRLTKRPEATAH